MAGTIVSGAGGREFDGVSIDSRTLGAGDLFIAIGGDRFDGVDFVPAAIAAGAGGVVVPSGRVDARAAGGDRVVIEVADTVEALQALGHAVRRASGARVVAITGSAGKTTTKEITAEFLAARKRVIRNRGNLNNHIGLPLSLIELRNRPDVAVVELGMNHAGEISTLVRIAEPEIRVWTNVGEAHLGFFESVEAIADAKAELLEQADERTVLVANADDDRVMARSRSFAGRVVTFGVARPAVVRAASVVDRGVEGVAATVVTPRGEVDLAAPLVGRGNLANVLAATAVALEFDVPLESIAERARALRPSAHRGQVVTLAGNIIVIDDSYNANPAAMRQSLDILAQLHGASKPGATSVASRPRRRVAVLGEMLELGEHAGALHEQVGRYAAGAGLDLLIAVGGGPAESLARAAVQGGMAAGSVRYFSTSDDAAEAVASLVQPGDVVLVKGSRSVRTDRVVDRLAAERG